MTQAVPQELFEPRWFLLLFVLMWFAICGTLALLSGWWGLASRFAASGQIEGQRFRFVSGAMGLRFFPVNYGNCLFVSVNDRGFRLAILFLFRFLSPPLFVPWAAVESVAEKKFLFMRYAVVRIRENWPIISFFGKAGKRILAEYAKASGKEALQ